MFRPERGGTNIIGRGRCTVLLRNPYAHLKVLKGPLSACFGADSRDPLCRSEDVLACSRVNIGAVSAFGFPGVTDCSLPNTARDGLTRYSPSVRNSSPDDDTDIFLFNLETLLAKDTITCLSQFCHNPSVGICHSGCSVIGDHSSMIVVGISQHR